MTEETWSQYSARLERERRELETDLQNHQAVLAALVVKYGELVHGKGYRLAVTERELTEVARGELRAVEDPNSGALLIRFRPE